jgi:DNA-binding CsgD family transcriptional regulator
MFGRSNNVRADRRREGRLKSSHAVSVAGPAEFERLNETERRVLRLLAEGHTAKSIAAATGCSPAAVNERLREARRKTGIGSSRELARLLRAQENRDDEKGLAPPDGATAAEARQVPRRAARQGVFAMSLLLIGGLAAALRSMPVPRRSRAQSCRRRPRLVQPLMIRCSAGRCRQA